MDAVAVSAVQGVAAGAGVPLAGGADLVLAAASRFTFSYTAIGLSPDGGSSLLTAGLGLHRALLNPAPTAAKASMPLSPSARRPSPAPAARHDAGGAGRLGQRHRRGDCRAPGDDGLDVAVLDLDEAAGADTVKRVAAELGPFTVPVNNAVQGCVEGDGNTAPAVQQESGRREANSRSQLGNVVGDRPRLFADGCSG